MPRSSLFLVLAALLAAPGRAAAEAPKSIRPLGTILSSTALNASPSFTIENPGGAFSKVLLAMNRTRNAGTDLTMTCSRTNTAGIAAKVQTCSWTGGTCAHVDVVWSDASAVSEITTFEINVHGYPTATCTVASTASNGSDLISVTGDLVSE